MKSERKVILYIAATLDGYIAKPNDDLSFLDIVQKEDEDYGYQAFVNSVDTVIMGRKTYDWVMTKVPEFPHQDKETYIITRTTKPSIGNTHFYNGDLAKLIETLKITKGKNIFVDGGAEIVNELLKLQLIDEFIISTIPIILGDGIKLFQKGFSEQKLQLINNQIFEKGLVQLHYKKII